MTVGELKKLISGVADDAAVIIQTRTGEWVKVAPDPTWAHTSRGDTLILESE